ncbi:MAG: T9SS type A sorting domain-containing protein, partial [Saprospiraceae bacterium]|nr:T9SS type A sorting domain-containing protein [Saprospiraceae bacterium]
GIQLSSGSNAFILRFPSASQGILSIAVFRSTGLSQEFLSNYINTPDVGAYRITGIVYQEDRNPPRFEDFFLLPCAESDFDFLTSTNEPAWANELVVFPNPTSDEVNVRSSVDIEEWRLIDLQGRVLSRGTNNNQRFAVDLGEWPSGLYRLQLINGNEAVQRPVVKQ